MIVVRHRRPRLRRWLICCVLGHPWERVDHNHYLCRCRRCRILLPREDL